MTVTITPEAMRKAAAMLREQSTFLEGYMRKGDTYCAVGALAHCCGIDVAENAICYVSLSPEGQEFDRLCRYVNDYVRDNEPFGPHRGVAQSLANWHDETGDNQKSADLLERLAERFEAG